MTVKKMTAKAVIAKEHGTISPMRYVNNVIDSADFIKTGKKRGHRHTIDAMPFSSHRARAVSISDFSFPTFIIRRPTAPGKSLSGPRSVSIKTNDEEETL